MGRSNPLRYPGPSKRATAPVAASTLAFSPAAVAGWYRGETRRSLVAPAGPAEGVTPSPPVFAAAATTAPAASRRTWWWAATSSRAWWSAIAAPSQRSEGSPATSASVAARWSTGPGTSFSDASATSLAPVAVTGSTRPSEHAGHRSDEAATDHGGSASATANGSPTGLDGPQAATDCATYRTSTVGPCGKAYDAVATPGYAVVQRYR